MATWLLQVLLPSRFPGIAIPDSVEDLMGFKSILAQRAKQWPQQWMEEGREKGRREGQARQLAFLLERKFGELPRTLRRQVDSADADTLMEWAGRVLVADDPWHVFNGHLSDE